MSFSGLNTPAFIISINAVPPAIGRTLGSSGFEQLDGRRERGRFGEVEGDHLSSGGVSANAARSRVANIFSMSLALERSTGWPMLPSLPASVNSTE